MAVSHVKSDTIADWTGTVTVFDSAGNTGTVAATNLVRPSDWNSVHNVTNTFLGSTFGSSTHSGTNIVTQFSAGVFGSISNNATLTIAGAVVSVWPPFASPPINFKTVDGGTTTTTAGGSASTWNFSCVPIVVANHLEYDVAALYISGSSQGGSGTQTVNAALGLYTLTGSTLSKLTTYGWCMQYTQNSITAITAKWNFGTNTAANSSSTTGNVSSLFTGYRNIILHSNTSSSLSPGNYWLVAGFVGILGGFTKIAWFGNPGFCGPELLSNTGTAQSFASLIGDTRVSALEGEGTFTTQISATHSLATMPNSFNYTLPAPGAQANHISIALFGTQ